MINCIVAVEKNQGIGYNNAMPWPFLSADMKWFKRLTVENVVIMGSSTWKSIKKKLPNRINIVISRNNAVGADHTFSSLESAILYSNVEYKDKEIFIIGGQQLYDSSMSIVDNFYITEIDQQFKCDKFFNLTYVIKNFKQVKIISTHQNPINYTIKEYTNDKFRK